MEKATPPNETPILIVCAEAIPPDGVPHCSAFLSILQKLKTCSLTREARRVGRAILSAPFATGDQRISPVDLRQTGPNAV